MKRKMLSLMLATSLATGLLAGCGNTDSTGKGQESEKSSEVSQSTTKGEESSEESSGVTFPLEEPITLNILAEANTNVPVDYDSMEYWKMVEEATGIMVNWTVAKSDEFTQKLNLALVSGEYPDVILGGSMQAVSKTDEEVYGVQQGVFIQLDEYINETYMPTLTAAMNEVPDAYNQIKATDGHIYSLPCYGNMGYTSAGHMFINKTWLDNLDMEIPTTIEELEAVLYAFKNNDPNGNGEADEIPYTALLSSDTQGVNTLAGCFGQLDPSNHLYIDEDKVLFSADTEEYRAYVEWINKLNQEGLIDPEAFSQDITTYYSKIQGGNVGFFVDWRLTTMSLSYEGIEDDYVCIEPVHAESIDKAIWNRTEANVATGAMVITTTNQYVEETIAWADYLYEPYLGLSSTLGLVGLMSTINEEGKLVPDKNEDGTMKYGNEEINQTSPAQGTLSFLTPSFYEKAYSFASAHLEKFPYCDMYEPYLCEIPVSRINLGRVAGEDLERMSTLQTDINKYMKESMVQFFSQGVTDDSWEAYKNTLKQMGLEEYVALKQKSYDLYLSTAE